MKKYFIAWTGDYGTETIFETNSLAEAEKKLQEISDTAEGTDPEEIDCERIEVIWDGDSKFTVNSYLEDIVFEDQYKLGKVAS